MAKIYGRGNIHNFSILLDGDEFHSSDFLIVNHFESSDVLCQIINITRDEDKLIADCKVIGYKDDGILKGIKLPFSKSDEIKKADENFICDIIGLKKESSDFIGVLDEHPTLKIGLDLKKVITKHISILAKSGSGKSYTVGVILEEVIKKNIPILIIDPHGEYLSLKSPNDNSKDIKRLSKFGLKPVNFNERINIYKPGESSAMGEKLTLNLNDISARELIDILPAKLTPSQQNLLYTILLERKNIDLDEIIFTISNEDNPSKWQIISLLEHIKKLGIFSSEGIDLTKLISFKKTSVLNLKGVDPVVCEIFLAQLLKLLFLMRKEEKIPPFLLVLEEAHNFACERNLGELKTSKIIRTIAAEGRKFGLGLCIVSQRAAKIDKNVLSQCSTQIILKMTNPQDLRAVVSSSEGVTNESENEIQKLNIGTALLCGVVDIPLKVNIRPRITKHGGETVDVLMDYEKNIHKIEDSISLEKEVLVEELTDENLKEYFEFLDLKEYDLSKKYFAVPILIIEFENSKSIIVDLKNKKIISSFKPIQGTDICENILKLSQNENQIVKSLMSLNDIFSPAELLMSTNYSYNEILKTFNNLESLNLIKKNQSNYELCDLSFVKNLDKFNQNVKFKMEEIEVEPLEDTITEKQVLEILENFFKIKSSKKSYFLVEKN